MILTCPACGTQYVVKDGAIPEGGRKVRCASCRHSWHQDAPPLELEEPLEAGNALATDIYDEGNVAPEPVDDGYAEEGPSEAEPVEDHVQADPFDRHEPLADRAEEMPQAPPPDQLLDEPAEPAEPYAIAAGSEFAQLEPPAEDVDDDFSPFAARDPMEPKRRSPIVAAFVVIILVAALAALFWFLAPPEWKSRIGLAEAGQTPLQLMMTHSDRQALASGNELLAVSGRVINPTNEAQRVPPIQAELRSKAGQVVYRWTIAPPTTTLAPGASARFNSAEMNVPAGGEELTVSLGAPGA